MTLAIDITDGWGLSNKAHHELLPKVNGQLYSTNKTERFSFNGGKCFINKVLQYKAGLNIRIT